MKYLSLFSGIEAASVAWDALGWEPIAFAEIETFPSAVLKHHFDVPNLGDITKVDWSQFHGTGIDVLVGGSPCQSFSVAGLRRGLRDPRGNLALEYLRAVDAIRPRWVVWENVPGVLSSDGGRDFGAFIGGLAELGYGYAWRVLDAQYVRVQSHPRAVPQRRKRLFVVGCLGDWRGAAAVLLERESLFGHPAPSRKAGEIPAGFAGEGFEGGGGLQAESGAVRGLKARYGTSGVDLDDAEAGHLVAHTLTKRYDSTEDGTGRGLPLVMASGQANAEFSVDCGTTLSARQYKDPPIVSFMPEVADPLTTSEQRTYTQEGSNNFRTHNVMAFSIREDATANTFSATEIDAALALGSLRPSDQSHHAQTFLAADYTVRRLTPLECERLQGFPDGWTDIPYRGQQHPADSPRYKSVGNSMAVNVMAWLGGRIGCVDRMMR